MIAITFIHHIYGSHKPMLIMVTKMKLGAIEKECQMQ